MERRSESGFTIIELVVVIALLGLLAAVALPRFTNLRGEAQTAAFRGVQGSFHSAIALAHATWLAQNSPAQITLEGALANVSMSAAGYPTIDAANPTQDTAAELYELLMQSPLPAGWTSGEAPGAGAGTATLTLTGAPAPNTINYDAATGAITTS